MLGLTGDMLPENGCVGRSVIIDFTVVLESQVGVILLDSLHDALQFLDLGHRFPQAFAKFLHVPFFLSLFEIFINFDELALL